MEPRRNAEVNECQRLNVSRFARPAFLFDRNARMIKNKKNETFVRNPESGPQVRVRVDWALLKAGGY